MFRNVMHANEEDDPKEIISYTQFLYTVRFIKLESILLDPYLVLKEERNILSWLWIILLNGQKPEQSPKLQQMQPHNFYMNKLFVNMVALKLFLAIEERILIMLRLKH